MRRMVVIVVIVFSIALPVLAQTSTPPPGDPIPLDIQILTDRVEDAAQRVAADAQKTNDAVNHAFDLLGLFEAIGLVVTIFGVAGGLLVPVVGGYYVRNIRRATTELKTTRGEVATQLEQTQSLQETSRKLEGQLKSASDEFKSASERLERDVQLALNRLEQQMVDNKTQLGKLREDLSSNAETQRKRTSRALMGQSLQSLGERQYRERDLKGSIETLVRALELDEENPITHYQLGYVYVHSGILDKAAEHLKRALEIDPNLAQALAALGYTYRRMGEKLAMGHERLELMNSSEAKLLEALKISPRLIDDDGESWWGSLGGLYRRQGQIDQAIHVYSEAAQVTPRSSYPYSNLAMLYLARGERDLMMQNFAKVETLAFAETQADTNNYWAFADLVTSRLAQKKLESANTAVDALLFTVPAGSNYVLESLIDTLVRLIEGLGGAEAAPHIPPYIQRIREHLENHMTADLS